MMKKYLTIFKIINLVIFILLGSFSFASYSKENGISVKIIAVDSAFIPNPGDADYEPDNVSEDFSNEISQIHPPILVDYDGQKSLLLFLPPNKDDELNSAYIYNFNLANQKMNVVNPSLEGKILSVFSYDYKGRNPSIILITSAKSGSSETLYRVWMYSVLKEGGGLYVQSFKDDRFGISGLTSCIEQVGNTCKYKDAASIKKYLDDMNRKSN